MMAYPVLFVSQNPFKYEELAPLFQASDIEVIYIKKAIKEIQSDDLKEIIKQKTLSAFQEFGRPVLVEHTGLFINAWGGMPGGLTQLFWDTLGGEKICHMLSNFADRSALAKTVMGFCDGRQLFLDFEGSLKGFIADKPHGGREFQWGTIFIPDGHPKAYSELEVAQLNLISHRANAFKQFSIFWRSRHGRQKNG